MRPQIVTLLTLGLFICNSATLFGQSTGKDSGPPPPAQLTGPELHIDSNILWLLFAGLLLGIIVILFKKKSKSILD